MNASNDNHKTAPRPEDGDVVPPHHTAAHTQHADTDRTIVMGSADDIDRTVVSAASVTEKSGRTAPRHRKDETLTHFSLFNLDHTWFQRGKDVNESIDRNRQASLDEVRLDSIHAFQNTELSPELADKDELYEHIKVFNEGGQGIISKVREKALDRVVALKSLRKELLGDAAARRNFLTEAKVSAQLEHPSIIPIYSLTGDDGNGLHLAMKLVSGMTLTGYLEETSRHYKLDGIRNFNEDKALRFRLDLFLRICDAMSYAHSHNIMHRDLKPENIIIGEFREVYIMDWGIATHIVTQPEDAEDGKKHVSGTPRFMAPEVIRGEAIDQRADVYALGLILFEMVYLKTGYTGKDTPEIFGKVLRGECESFEHYFGWKISPELTAIVKKAMHPRLSERYQSTMELAQDLRRYLDGEETKAHPDNRAEKILRFIGKHRRGVAAAIIFLVLLALGNASYNFYQQRNEQRYRVRYNRAVGYSTTRMDDAAYELESQMLKLENVLRLFSAEVSIRLGNAPEPSGSVVLPPMKAAAADVAEAGDSQAYRQIIDPAHMGYFIAGKNSDRPAAMEEVKRLTAMAENTRRNVLDLTEADPEQTPDAPEKRLMAGDNPVLWIYFGSENGLYFQYPRGSSLPENYDPRLRPWYELGKNAAGDQLVWSRPYSGVQTGTMLLTCAQAIRRNGNFLGVAALDVTLTQFRKVMETCGTDKRYAYGKYLLDRDGNILVTANQQSRIFHSHRMEAGQKPLTNIKELGGRETGWRESGSGYPMGGKELFAKMWWGDLGQITLERAGKRVMVLYSRIRSLDWLYVEVVDLDRFMQENWDVLEDMEKLDQKLRRTADAEVQP